MNTKRTVPAPGDVTLRCIRKSVKKTSDPYAWMNEYRVPLFVIHGCTLILRNYWRGIITHKEAIRFIKRIHPLAGNPRYLQAIISTPPEFGRNTRRSNL